MSRICLHGYYGMGNLGDEAILQALLRQFRDRHGLKTTVFSRNPGKVAEQYGVRSIHALSRRHLLKRIWNLKTAGLYALGGGGLLKDYGNSSSSLESWMHIFRLCKKLHVKTALCAVGVENIHFPRTKTVLEQVLNQVDLLTVRDEDSKILLKNIGIEKEIIVTSDPAILLAKGTPREIPGKGQPLKVTVCVRHWYDRGFFVADPAKNENLVKALSQALDFLVDNYNARIDFIPMRTISYDDDREMAKKILQHMKNKTKTSTELYSYSPSVDEFIRLVDQSTLIIGMRLHSLILGAASGIPVIALEYMPKVSAFMKSINQHDYSFQPGTVTKDDIIPAITKTFNSFHERSRFILNRVSTLKEITEETIARIVNTRKNNG